MDVGTSDFSWERQLYLHERICTKYNNIIMVCLVRAAQVNGSVSRAYENFHL